MTSRLIFWEPMYWSFDYFFICPTSSEQVENLFNCIVLGYLIYFIGLFGVLLRKTSIIFIFISMELALLGLNLVFLFLSLLLFIPQLQVIVILLLTVSAAETAIGLSLIYHYNRIQSVTELDSIFNELKY